MSQHDDHHGDPADGQEQAESGEKPEAREESAPERAAELFGRGVRTALRNNATAYGLSRVPGFAAWPLTGAGTVVSYLLASGLDILLARTVARHTNLGRSQ